MLHQETMTLCNKLCIPCSIFESTMALFTEFHEFLQLQKRYLNQYQNTLRINYLIYRSVQKYFTHLIIICKPIVQDTQNKVRNKVKETLERPEVVIVLHQETMTLCKKLYILCSIFESTMAAIYGISRIPSAAKALTRPISK